MKQPASAERPALKPGCRLSPPTSADSLLFIPEGALRLEGPGRRILELCDGRRTLAELIEQLLTEFPSANAATIAGEVATYLARLQEKGAIEFL